MPIFNKKSPWTAFGNIKNLGVLPESAHGDFLLKIVIVSVRGIRKSGLAPAITKSVKLVAMCKFL